ncbi:hypothetical protein VTL71DRAFT_4710 [Oculimacula yallundae]|uniref:Zn(2)-C6 fungal-type domain-containing protein n=1 Tax=Oculimacula yallundae TaxID=86028 RepID=A0ABR4C4E3_9HELO
MFEIGRKRARTPKTKTGCKTCKIRRIKCDEGRPSCLRCTSTGRKCDGYETKLSERVKSEDLSQQHDLRLVCTKTRLGAIPGVVFKDGQEKRAFDFFRHRTAADMSGFFPSQFWDGLLLQASHSEPAILHAVIALGSLHELYQDKKTVLSEGGEPSLKQQFALQQSNKAIGHLTKPSIINGSRSAEAILISCLLFICLETFQGNHNGAMAHLDSGLKILRSMGHIEPSLGANVLSRQNDVSDQQNLVNLFSRLDTQASTYLPRRPICYGCPGEDSGSCLEIYIPEEFSSIGEANTCLQSQVNEIVRYIQKVREHHETATPDPYATPASQIPEHLILAQIEHTKQLSCWLTVMNKFLKDPKVALTPQDLRGAVLLKMQQITTNIMLASTIFNDQTEYDNLTGEFERVVVLATNLLTSLTSSDNEQKPHCSFDMSVVPSLYNAACRCRDPVIRRKAISLLVNSARREGIWDSDVSAAVAKRVVEIEERGLGVVVNAGCVPMEARIHILDKEFVSGERKCFVRFRKGRMGIIEEWITW